MLCTSVRMLEISCLLLLSGTDRRKWKQLGSNVPPDINNKVTLSQYGLMCENL